MTSLPACTPAGSVPLCELVDAISERTGAWVAVERLGKLLVHGKGTRPCPPSLACAIVAKSTSPLRRATTWSRGARPMRGTVDGVSVVVTELCPGAYAWFVDGPLETLSLPAVTAALAPDPGPLLDPTVDGLLHPRGPSRPGAAPAALLVVVVAGSSAAELSRRAAAAMAGADTRVHVDGDVVVIALPPDGDAESLIRHLKGVDAQVVAGAALVPRQASDWAATFRLANALAHAARRVGVVVGSIRNPAVLADVVLHEARGAATDLIRDLPFSPLRKLSEYDRRTSSHLVATLTAWCDSGLDVATAAAATNVHPNTLRYRLRRAGEIGGIDLAQPRQLLAIQLLLAT